MQTGEPGQLGPIRQLWDTMFCGKRKTEKGEGKSPLPDVRRTEVKAST